MGLAILIGFIACEQARTGRGSLNIIACIPNAFASLTGHTEQARTGG